MRRRNAEHRQRDVARRSVDGERAPAPARRRPALPAPIRTAARRSTRSSRTPRSTSSRCDAPAHSTTARGASCDRRLQQQRTRPRPAIRRRRRDRRCTITDAPAARRDVGRTRSPAWRTPRSAPPARCRAPCRRRRSGLVDQADRPGDVAPRQHVRERAAQLAGADDGDFAASVDYCNGGIRAEKNMFGFRISRTRSMERCGQVASSPADRAGIGSRSRARSSPRASRSRSPARSDAHLSAARPRIEGAGPRRRRDAAGRRPPLRRHVAAPVDATVARFGGLDILVNNAGVGIFAERRRHDARSSGPRSSTRT